MAPKHFQIAIIGAGPAGLGAATNAAEHKLSHILFEKREIGNTIYDYQLRKHVMAEPSKLPLRAKVDFQAGTREQILESWNQAVIRTQTNVCKAEVLSIKKNEQHFEINTSNGLYTAEKVILAIGVQGTPRKLGVSGEDQDHVKYTLSDPDAFNSMNIIVVGAGDAGIENALGLANKNNVTIINRNAEFARAKDANISLIQKAIESEKLKCLYSAEVSKVEKEHTYVNTPEGEVKVKCEHLIARLGCIMPRKFLESIGIKFPSADLNAVPVVSKNYESNISGLYIVGALIGYPLIKQAINQGYEVIEHILGNHIEPADQVLVEEKLRVLAGDVNQNLEKIRQALPLFKDLSDSQFRELIIDSNIQIKNPESVIFERNDYTDTFYSVISGTAYVDLPNGRKIEFQAGEFFGEMGLLSGRRRTATVKAKDALVLLESPRKQILKLISSVDSVKLTLDQAFILRVLETSIFPDADPKFLREVVKKAQIKNFKKSDLIFKEGDLGDALYVVRKGSAKISKKNVQGQDIILNYIPAGNYFGEMALLDSLNDKRSATVTAAVACETIMIAKADFQEILSAHPALKNRIEQKAKERKVENTIFMPDKKASDVMDFMLKQGISDAENVLLIDSDLCVGCDNCEKACAGTHFGYSRLDRKGGKSFASIQVPISCRHCENPLCMLDCPPDALTRQPNGEVVIKDSCIGCGNCVRNCPYAVIQMVYDKQETSFSLWSLLGLGAKEKKAKGPAKAGKCDMCSSLSSGPACVRACPTGAAMRVNPQKAMQIITSKAKQD